MSESEILRSLSRAKYFLTLAEEELKKSDGKALADCEMYISDQQLCYRWNDAIHPWLTLP